VGIVSSAAPPVLLAAGWTIAASLQAERVVGEAQAAWPFVVVMSCRHPVTAHYRLVHEGG